MTHSPRSSPRSEYQQREQARAANSLSLGEAFPLLHTLTVHLDHYGTEGAACSSQVKYTVNLIHAKSVFRVGCHNQDCVRGDFDLSDVIAAAVAARRTSVTGEITCQGWRNRAGIETIPCHNRLRYKLTLGY